MEDVTAMAEQQSFRRTEAVNGERSRRGGALDGRICLLPNTSEFQWDASADLSFGPTQNNRFGLHIGPVFWIHEARFSS
ncbi:hypothetical protein Csa_018273 [Cucumis sativus]|uniref:Uncharacterized protein n=1 Tax=Cucumis sativus TaxID=3659 RepID=A0A0A0KIS7_CUCSA|nr:hypothetical protein Csa_018273 [Cucumis sativus]